MTSIIHAFLWASAILLAALAGANGLVPAAAQQMLAVTLPLAAAVSLSRTGSCSLSGKLSRRFGL